MVALSVYVTPQLTDVYVFYTFYVLYAFLIYDVFDMFLICQRSM